MQGYYMLVRQGMVQRLDEVTVNHRTGRGWPVAKTHDDAMRLAQYLNSRDKRSVAVAVAVTVAQIGSAPGETLEGHIRLALEEGCIGAVCVMGWNVDGSPQFGAIEFE